KLQHATLATFGQIDHGLVLLWNENWAQLMPHGGPRVVQKLVDQLLKLGVTLSTVNPKEVDARLLYPEAATALEADMLATLAAAASPAAVDLLLGQPALWEQTKTRLAQADETKRQA